MRDFMELSTARAIGFGALGPIPWPAIDAYGRRHGIEVDEFEIFVGHIRALDGVYLEKMNKNDT